MLHLSADRLSINADAMDVSHIKVEIIDENGLVVPTADNRILFNVEGAGTLLGVDNGNPTDHGSFLINERDAFNGLALAIVRSTMDPGKITISAESAAVRVR